MKGFFRHARWPLAVFVLGLVVGYVGSGGFSRAADDTSGYYQKKQVFESVLGYVRDMYVERSDLSPAKLYYGAIDGLLASLEDPHSRLMRPDDYRQMQTEIHQEFGGLGIYITVREGRLTVIAPIEGTPAFEAGLMPGDVITAIDGESAESITTAEEAVQVLRGPKGSEVTLTLDRHGATEEVTIERGNIPIQSVFSSMLVPEKRIGYIKITNFGEETDEEVKDALQSLHEEGMRALLLDLRNNPGGSLQSSYRVADLWIREGRVVSIRGRTAGQNKNFPATEEGTESDYPMAVLVNGGSASGSEILTGALRDHQRALVLGDTTFGKGLVQSVFPLQDGSALALTTARYYTPDGQLIQDRGIGPHRHISQTLPDTDVRRQLARLSRGDTVLNFVREHPEPNPEELDAFVERLRAQGFSLDQRYILHQVRRQRLAHEGKTFVADPATDPQLQESLETFQSTLEDDGRDFATILEGASAR